MSKPPLPLVVKDSKIVQSVDCLSIKSIWKNIKNYTRRYTPTRFNSGTVPTIKVPDARLPKVSPTNRADSCRSSVSHCWQHFLPFTVKESVMLASTILIVLQIAFAKNYLQEQPSYVDQTVACKQLAQQYYQFIKSEKAHVKQCSEQLQLCKQLAEEEFSFAEYYRQCTAYWNQKIVAHEDRVQKFRECISCLHQYAADAIQWDKVNQATPSYHRPPPSIDWSLRACCAGKKALCGGRNQQPL